MLIRFYINIVLTYVSILYSIDISDISLAICQGNFTLPYVGVNIATG